MENKKAPAAATAEALPSAELDEFVRSGSAPSGQARIRPGITNSFLEENGVHHVDAEEAKQLCGLREPGLCIPYEEELGVGECRLDRVSPPTKQPAEANCGPSFIRIGGKESADACRNSSG